MARQALVVDDSGTTRRIIAGLLRELQFEVVEAQQGQEGLALLRQLTSPAVVLVDWNMPELDGIGFVRAVRADPVFREVRLIMVTTELEMGRVAQALADGADEYLMKPFTREMLVDKLALVGVRGVG